MNLAKDPIGAGVSYRALCFIGVRRGCPLPTITRCLQVCLRVGQSVFEVSLYVGSFCQGVADISLAMQTAEHLYVFPVR